jgi:hypothetical protein
LPVDVQVTQLLWNLFDLAPESANTAGALSSSSSAVVQQGRSGDQQQQQGPEAASNDDNGSVQDACVSEPPQQQHQQQQLAHTDQLHGSRVAHQLVLALASALQQQVATCSSLQVSLWLIVFSVALMMWNTICCWVSTRTIRVDIDWHSKQ